MTNREWKLLFIFGLVLLLEGLLIGIDWSQYGIPSIFIGEFHLHHWIIGCGMILVSIYKGGVKI